MTALFPIHPAYELPVWPASSDSYEDLWSLLGNEEYPNQLPLLTDIELPDDAFMDPMFLNHPESFPTHGISTLEPISSLHRISTPEPGQLNRMSTPDPSQFYNIPTPESSPLPRMTTPDPSSLHNLPTPEPSPVRIISTARPGSLYIKPTPKPSPLPPMSTPEPSPLDSVPTPEPSPLPNKSIPESLRSSPAPTSTLHSMPPHPSLMHSTPPAAFGPLQSMPAQSQMTEVKLEASQVKSNSSGRFDRLALNSGNDEQPMDCGNNETLFPKSVKKEAEQQDSTENSMKNEVNTDQNEQLANDAEESASNIDRPARRCNSRYSFRSNRGGSLYKQSRPTVRKTVVLWKFIKELLDKNDPCVSWISREERSFKFVDSKQAAKLWGQRKNKRNMTYEKMSRALRYYYDRQIMYHEEGQKLMYRFGDGARDDREQNELDESER